MSRRYVFVGIDCGGSHTRAVLANIAGDLRAVPTAGCGNLQAIGSAAAGRSGEQAEVATLIVGRQMGPCTRWWSAMLMLPWPVLTAVARYRG